MNDKAEDKDKRVEFQKKLGEYLKLLMKEKNIGSSELAARCFMEKSNVMRIRRGAVNPSVFILSKFCNAMEISLEEFFKGFEKFPQKKRSKK